MPKRSNDFQKLIRLIEAQIASDNVTIEESKLIEDKRSGQSREVDIFIQSEINGHSVSIAIECTDRKRKVGSTWVEQLIGKYKALSIDKVIAVSKSGFTKPANKVAIDSKITLLTLEDAVNENWFNVIEPSWKINLTMVRFKIVNVAYELTKGLFEENEENIFVVKSGEKELGTFQDFLTNLIYEDPQRAYLSKMLIENYDLNTQTFKNGNKVAKVSWTPKNEAYTLKDNYKFISQLKHIEYSFTCQVSNSSISTDRFTYNKAQVATTTKKVLDIDVMFTLVKKENLDPTLALTAEFERPNGEKYSYEIISTPLPFNNLSVGLVGFVLG